MRRIMLCIVCFIMSLSSQADRALLYKKDARHFIYQMVNQYHFDKRQLRAIFIEAQFQPHIIESMERPYEKKNWDVYQALFLTSMRAQAGSHFWAENEHSLHQAQEKFSVPAAMIVSILGIETLYGKNQGSYRVLDALTTLAFYYPQRSEFFTKELKEYLLLCREHGVSATQYVGSYAGAMGKPQFMPSSYRAYAVNLHGKGRTDLMHQDPDVIASVANYFQRHGWKDDAFIAQRAQVAPAVAARLSMNAKAPNYTLATLLQAGVKSLGPLPPQSTPTGLLELTTDAGPEYWLVFPNFYVITHYNTSPQYALVAYLLSEQLRQQHTSHTSTLA